jgi:hypothetical protein
MSDRLFHAVANDSLKEELLGNLGSGGSMPPSSVLSFVKELNHTYGLKVYVKSRRQGYDGFTMCNDEGLPIARVFFHDGAYHYHSPYQQKSRGSDHMDRQTYRSTKLSTLMATLKKVNVVTTTDRVLFHYRRRTTDLVTRVSGSFSNQSKDSMPSSFAQKLLQAMVDGKSMDSFQQSDRDKYLELLDIYKKVDIIQEERKKGIESMFKDGYLILGDVNGHYIISESSYEYTDGGIVGAKKYMQIKPTSPFKRVTNLNNYPSVLSTLTMLKVHLGGEFRPYADMTSNSLFPRGDKYISDLEVVYGYESNSGNDFDMGWLCLSK